MATTKTCTRCKGKGWGTWHVDHGRCFRCDGCGVTVHYTMAERVALFVARCEASLASYANEAAQFKAAAERARDERNARRAERGLPAVEDVSPRFTRELETLREAYRTVRAQLRAVQESGRVAPAQQATFSPAIVNGRRVAV